MKSDLITKLENARNWEDGAQYGAIITVREIPELLNVAEVCGEAVQVGRFTVTRRKVDQLDQFTVSLPPPQVARCPVCNMRLEPDGSCWWCKNPD